MHFFLRMTSQSCTAASEWPKTFVAKLKADIQPKFKCSERVVRYGLVQFHLSRPIKNDLANAKVYLQVNKPAQESWTIPLATFCWTTYAVLVLNNYKAFKFYGKNCLEVGEPTLAALLIKLHAMTQECSPEHWFLFCKRSKAGAHEKATWTACRSALSAIPNVADGDNCRCQQHCLSLFPPQLNPSTLAGATIAGCQWCDDDRLCSPAPSYRGYFTRNMKPPWLIMSALQNDEGGQNKDLISTIFCAVLVLHYRQ
jgi:hypothetical protein